MNKPLQFSASLDEVVKSYDFSENPNYKITTAEVMTFAITSALRYHERL